MEIEKDHLDRNYRGLVNADILRTWYAPSGRGGGMAVKVGVADVAAAVYRIEAQVSELERQTEDFWREVD